ncbi:MAG: hypothetical protein QNI87_11590 [Erythrobacter sp.]|uniref:hypothetical protein n=1 Tax=Erythrobacter sp. TaxID=1042 RepID=UPI00260F60CB|nr:hypothetical protein [Erythrobacter sp.]MDJ0979161.1 hypothetical protein [Erythrobacter sp.]
MLTVQRSAASWQLILADLALILFLVTAAALSATSRVDPSPTPSAAPVTAGPRPRAPAQALYRPGPELPTLAQWLEQQSSDPRATLTIIAEHRSGEAEQAWADARRMAATARTLGVRSRVIIREGAASDIHASLAYDQPALR